MLRCAIHPFTYRGEGILLHLLKEIETLLQPENISSASDEELIRKVIPRSEYHLSEVRYFSRKNEPEKKPQEEKKNYKE